MLRYNLLMVALGGVALAAALPREGADAQSGPSLVYAEHACLEYGVPPLTALFENCVGRAATAFDRGQPDIAYQEARLARDARRACLNGPNAPADDHQCETAEVDRRTSR